MRRMTHEEQDFKIPVEISDYEECSRFVTHAIHQIIDDAIARGSNKIVINTNLKFGLLMQNINKIAGPFIEAWAVQTFHAVLDDNENQYALMYVEALERLHLADVILQFKKVRSGESGVTASVDVKATAEDIGSSGKSPNITSFARIRSAYVEDPDLVFVILSLKHRVYSSRNPQSGLIDGTMEVFAHDVFDLKYLGANDISYNPALGTGQIQIRDIHYVDIEPRTTWEFCQLLDRKYLRSSRRSFEDWLALAKRHGWIKSDD